MKRTASSSSPTRLARQRLTLVCLLLAAVLALLWLTPGALARWRQWRPPAPQPPALGDAELALLQLRPAPEAVAEQTLQRPLFSTVRRPGPEEAAGGEEADVEAGPTLPIELVRLLGLVDAAGTSGAMVESGGVTQFVRVGEEVPGTGGWRLASIERRAASFEGEGGALHRMELPFLEGISAPVPAPAPVLLRRGH